MKVRARRPYWDKNQGFFPGVMSNLWFFTSVQFMESLWRLYNV
jgi:hypothetical protein